MNKLFAQSVQLCFMIAAMGSMFMSYTYKGEQRTQAILAAIFWMLCYIAYTIEYVMIKR